MQENNIWRIPVKNITFFFFARNALYILFKKKMFSRLYLKFAFVTLKDTEILNPEDYKESIFNKLKLPDTDKTSNIQKIISE